ncbi:MAG: hypothetical protein JWM91_5163 [Rhodospirillales bacterium]|nr:hypothetical protein [Rhodospirillales bacterium]
MERVVFLPKPEKLKATDPVAIEEKSIDGVQVGVITPRDGVSAANRDRVLTRLHAGAS